MLPNFGWAQKRRGMFAIKTLITGPPDVRLGSMLSKKSFWGTEQNFSRGADAMVRK
jgi:hypothetical protein